MQDLTIESGRVAVLEYTLTGTDGKVLDTSAGRAPMAYLHGHGNIVQGLEKALAGHKAGDRIQVEVAPADGYGESTGEAQAVPRREFGKKVDLRKGAPIRMENSSGETVVLWVHDIRGSRVWIHTDHPLAGQTLHFDVSVVAVREATSSEREHGHAHGIDGHHHHH